MAPLANHGLVGRQRGRPSNSRPASDGWRLMMVRHGMAWSPSCLLRCHHLDGGHARPRGVRATVSRPARAPHRACQDQP
jgi:hypothetical protein